MVRGLDAFKDKNDILRIVTEFILEEINDLPDTVHMDVENFIKKLGEEPFDANLLKEYGLNNEEVVDRFRQLYGL